MRPLEIIIPLLLALYLISRDPRPPYAGILPLVALVLSILHPVVEGYRWQMIPLYALAALLGWVALRGMGLTPFSSMLALAVLAAAVALPALLPVPSLPEPGGAYPVGTRLYELTDDSREEIYSGKAEPRRFQVQVWYPAQPGPRAERAPWMADADVYAPAIASYIHMPSFFLDHLELVRMPAYPDSAVAPAEAAYPVILFSHGWNGFSAQNTGQAIQLASHGYVVVGVQHTYGAVVTLFSDGTIAPNNPSALPEGAPDDEYEASARRLALQWAGDLAYALDFLTVEKIEAESPFYGLLDLSRVGVYGHSTGGGAAIQFCASDARCQSVLGLDPFMRPVSADVLDGGLTQPAFFLFSQRWADDTGSRNNVLFDRFESHVPRLLGVISIDGTTHYDFTDLPLLSPLAASLGLKGPIDGQRVTSIINDYLLSFFDQTLREKPASLFGQGDQKYNEVRHRK